MRSINPYIRKSLYLISLGLLIGLLVFLKKDHKLQTCEKIIVRIDAKVEQQLVTERLINERISSWYIGGLIGISQAELSLEDVERKIESMPAVLNAEVSFDLRGTLLIAVEQREPLVRIIPSSKESYYLASGMIKIPVAGTDVARVPIANGRLTNAMIKKVYTLSTYVHENTFMKALTEQIFVDNTGDLVIIPKVKNQRLIIGDTMQLEEKFSKLIDFYSEGLNHIGWDKYKIINLKYRDQIVCRE
jgi:cell division protein FtsQ